MKTNKVSIILFLHFFSSTISAKIFAKKFPTQFAFGTATSAYQIEGAWKEDGKGENIWDRFIHTHPNKIANKANADIACNSYHKHLEDVKLLQDLGVNFYRFSLSWSRILPTGKINQINQAGVNYYKNLINALKLNGIEPYVTLYHWDLPQPLQDIGGWPNDYLVHLFGDYARLAFNLFGDNVMNWVTFNEPKQTCQLGYGSGIFAPGITSDGVDSYKCAHNILKAHALAYHFYDEEFRKTQNGRVSITVDSQWFEPVSDSDEDKEAAERQLQFNLGWYANPVYSRNGNYPQVMIDRISARSKKEGLSKSRLPQFTQNEIDYIKGTFDFFAFNTYTTSLAKWRNDFPIGNSSFDADISVEIFSDDSWESSDSGWLKFVPWGMRKLLNWIDKNYDHPEIVITENGFSDSGDFDDQRRIKYHTEYLSNILQAIHEDGVNVTGYVVWSLMDNFEWRSGYTEKFGLYQVNFSHPNRTRTAKNSVAFYKKIISTRCLVEICED